MGQIIHKYRWVFFVLITSLILIIAIVLFTKRTPVFTSHEASTMEIQTTEVESTEIYATEHTSAETNATEPTTEMDTKAASEAVTEVVTESVTEPYVRPFAEYIEQNTDFAGWITVEGTTIDAPIVQSVDNEYYLIHDYTGARNITGAIYMDYKNLGNFYDNHISLYGHYMTDGTIFHDLHYFKDQAFFENNDTITIHGLRESKEFVIFSVHVVSAYTYYLYLDLEDEALLEYAKHFKRLSMFKRDVTFPKDLQLLTLVTCTYEYDNARILIHAFAK